MTTKNRDFFYRQYDKLHWENQEKTGLNAEINRRVINQVLSRSCVESLSVFDIGFGIGYFLRMLSERMRELGIKGKLSGCEPSEANFRRPKTIPADALQWVLYQKPFLEVQSGEQFDVVTAIYVFPHFISEDLELVVRKISDLLHVGGEFILVVANEKYLLNKLKSHKDLCIENGVVNFADREYKEWLHYSEIPEIGTIVDYNREEALYVDMFLANNFRLISREDVDDHGFVCTMFIFEKDAKRSGQ